MTTWADDKEQELFEAQETIAELVDDYKVGTRALRESVTEIREERDVAEAKNAELLEALEYAEALLYPLVAVRGWSLTQITEAIRKAKGE